MNFSLTTDMSMSFAPPDFRVLADRYGTPLYIYAAEGIRARIADLARFDSVRYAQKASSNLAILRLVRESGGLVDAVSAGEITRALEAGYSSQGSPPGIVYTADVFDDASLRLIEEHAIPVNIGSLDMLAPYAALAGRQGITLRVNPGFGHGHGPKVNTGGPWSKHGIWHAQLEEAVGEAARLGLEVTGFHMHIGSGADMEHLLRVATAAARLAEKCGSGLRVLSCGGGLPVPYRQDDPRADLADYFATWNQARDELSAVVGRRLHLEAEPGRYLVAESGWLVTQVLGTKRVGDHAFYLTDAGFNDLIRPAMYGAYHPLTVISKEPSRSSDQPHESVVVAGPLCESGDVFTQGNGGVVEPRPLPPAHRGDLIVIGIAGAYGAAMASNYNTKPLAAEVLIDHGVPRLIRRRQTLREVFASELGL